MVLNVSSSLQDAEIAELKKQLVTLKLDYADLFKGQHLVVCITMDCLSHLSLEMSLGSTFCALCLTCWMLEPKIMARKQSSSTVFESSYLS